MNPVCRCGHVWTDHRFVWFPVVASFGPCAHPCKAGSFERDAKSRDAPCECKAFTPQ